MKIIVDIVCPYGGKKGGVEDVIRAWSENLDRDLFDLRIMHMTPGIAYLNGYQKAYYLKEEKGLVDPSYCASGYNLLISQLGEPDICIATNYPFVTASCAQLKKYRSSKMAVLSWVHSEIWRYAETGNGGIPELLQADAHLAINKTIESEILEKKADAKVFNIGNPILHNIPELKTPSQKTLAFVGRLSEEKRLDIILEAMYKAQSKWNLRIIGDGQIRSNVEEWVNLLKLQKQVSFLGWQDEPLEYMTDVTALISASDYEGFMVTGAEALAMGLPVIGTPTQGLKEYVIDTKNGFLFNFDDADALASLLDKLADTPSMIPNAEICKNSVTRYNKEAYFRNVENALLLTYENIRNSSS